MRRAFQLAEKLPVLPSASLYGCEAGRGIGGEHLVIYHGDARQLIGKAEGMQSCITDPIWPNHSKVFKIEDAATTLWSTLSLLPESIKHVVIVMGCDSDPRWLREAVPMKYPFLKTQILEFCAPCRKGRNLYTNLNAYCFGEWPKSRPGARVIPSKYMSVESEKRLRWHPTPMRVTHCQYLVRWWGRGGVVDPFAGSGSFGVACKRMKVPYIGFEINENYVEKANRRIENEPDPML